MPLTEFICPDGERVPIDACLSKGGCRMKMRCATIPYLISSSYDREFKGISPSMAGNGIRLTMLKATVPYATSPDGRAFATLGTGTHDHLARMKYTDNVLAEEKLSDDEMTGIADALTEDEDKKGWHILYDYKTWGSYKVAKAMGVVAVDVPTGEVYKKDGKHGKKGDKKTKKEYHLDPTQADPGEVVIQLNRYRIFYERYGFKISQMWVMAIIRDGGTYMAKSRGLDQNIQMIPIPFIKNDDILEFYRDMQAKVDIALKENWAPKCSPEESWDGRRCDGYCEVSSYCELMTDKN